ncbi:hypothetical protein BKA61DRAFT_579211 [Leptodontidium sp. MPI-SDFR-AT-0119]|nr:hypothetical protein BKA61DRAFT_579211 [Leptodontidium sp. MPI-SDFR-AT-0119]
MSRFGDENYAPRRPQLSGSITSSVANEAFLLSPSPQPQPQNPKKHRSSVASRAGEARRLPATPTTSAAAREIRHQIAPETVTAMRTLTVDIANEYIRATTFVQDNLVWTGAKLMGMFFAGVLVVILVCGWVMF